MKNIHLIPTDNPTWLHKSLLSGVLRKSSSCIDDMKQAQGMNIYITDDSKIKEGDWCLLNDRLVVRYFKPPVESKSFKKIILTTDVDLIDDGIQSIYDEFLEWFINNPSCEEVNIRKVANGVKNHKLTYEYKIIIPKEEYTLEEQHVGHSIAELDKQYIKGFNEGAEYIKSVHKNLFSKEDLQTAFQLGRTYECTNHESTNQFEIVEYLNNLKKK